MDIKGEKMKKFLFLTFKSLLISCGLEPDTKEGNRLIVTDNAYYINYENTVLKLDDNVYLTKETRNGRLFCWISWYSSKK